MVSTEAVHPAVRARIETGDVEAVAAEWLADARRLIDRLQEGEADRDRAKTMLAAGARLEEEIDDGEKVGLLQRREEEIGDVASGD